MVEVEHHITVHRPLSEVFRFVSDSLNDPQWCAAVREVRQVAGGAPRKGAQYRIVSHPGLFTTRGECVITEWEEGHVAGYSGRNGLGAFHYLYEFEEIDGATIVHMVTHIFPRPIWKLAEGFLRQKTVEETQEEFQHLKLLLEGVAVPIH